MKKLLFLVMICAGLMASRTGFAQSCPPDNVPYGTTPTSYWIPQGWTTADLGGGCHVEVYICKRQLPNGTFEFCIGAIKGVTFDCFGGPSGGVWTKELLTTLLNGAINWYLNTWGCDAFPECPGAFTATSVVTSYCWQFTNFGMNGTSDPGWTACTSYRYCKTTCQTCCNKSDPNNHFIQRTCSQEPIGSEDCNDWPEDDAYQSGVCYNINPCQ